WAGELKIDMVLNADVTTAFPIDQAIGDLKPGVYVMTAEPEGAPRNEDYGQLATQWFIVSDLGLTVFSGNDGINVFLNSLATTEAKAGIEIRLIARNNEGLATRPTGTYRVRAYTDPKGQAVGTTSFLVEDYVPDRMEFDLASPTGKLSKETPAAVTVDGRFLYGAPASNLDLEGEMKIKAADARPGFAGFQFGANDDDDSVKSEQTS